MPDKIYIEESVVDLPLTQQVLSRCPDAARDTVSEAKDLIKSYNAKRRGDFFAKQTLLLCRNKGRFLEPCPGTRQYRCCGYIILTPGVGCPLDCSYCVLQAYLNNPFVTLYANLQDMLDELAGSPELDNGSITRIGTGEFMDSLALDHLTDFSSFILPFFRSKKNLVLELKTKTDNINNLLKLDHGGSFIISWSLNAEDITLNEEQGAVPIRTRLEAARCLIDRGYRVGFHFDPLVLHEGWEAGYKKTIELLAEIIPPASVCWISIGAFRYMQHLKGIGRKRFPETKIFSQEFVPGLDNKMRYLQDMRSEMYDKVISWLRDYSPDVLLYFCMENQAVWRRCMGFVPESNSALKRMLDERAV